MAKLNPNVFATFLAKPQPARTSSTSKVAVEASTFTPAPTSKVPNPAPINTITVNMPDRKPRSIGRVKVALIMTLTPAQRQAAQALPAGLLEVPADVIEFLHQHAAEVQALAGHLGVA